MILFFEEYIYTDTNAIVLLRQCIDDAYLTQTSDGVKVEGVGYFFNMEVNDSVFVMPKVFINQKGQAFGKYNPDKIVRLDSEMAKKFDNERETIFELSAWLYQAIANFVKRNPDTDIVKETTIQEVKSAKGENSETYIDIILQLRKFQKEHQHLFTYITIINHSGTHKIHWNKTIRKVQPIIQDGCPVYLEFYNKAKSINFDEELIVLFYSVLRYLQEKMRFKITSDLHYELISARKIEMMIQNGQGTRRLRTIRKKYFTDELVALWNLLYVFFEKSEQIANGRYHNEKLFATKFNLVFEDMVDQLISDDDAKSDLQKLKYQKDGKIVDHLYKDNSLINNCGDIYFIGDSKYYKEDTDLRGTAVYKQFTYAKNIIQYYIDIFNTQREYPEGLYYRDELTEGYNITPNFFIRASALKEEGMLYSFSEMGLSKELDDDNEKLKNYHFENRLFDRDTFVLQTYNINFLYVLAQYVQGVDISVQRRIREKFRIDLLERFNSLYDFWILTTNSKVELEAAIDKHFRRINGKVFCPNSNSDKPLLYLALEKELSAEALDHVMDFMMWRKDGVDDILLITELEEDFDIYKLHRLGDDPIKTINDIKISRMEQYHYDWYQNQYGELAAYKSSYNPQLDIYEHVNDVFVIGCYKDDAHKNWIDDNLLYNVRLDNRRGAVKEDDKQVVTTKYLILYNFENPSQYQVFILDNRQWVCKNVDMLQTHYPNPQGQKYLLYRLMEQMSLYDLSLIEILKDKHVQKGSDKEGAPVYLTGKDIMQYINLCPSPKP